MCNARQPCAAAGNQDNALATYQVFGKAVRAGEVLGGKYGTGVRRFTLEGCRDDDAAGPQERGLSGSVHEDERTNDQSWTVHAARVAGR